MPEEKDRLRQDVSSCKICGVPFGKKTDNWPTESNSRRQTKKMAAKGLLGCGRQGLSGAGEGLGSSR